MGVLLIWRHSANIKRLFAGTESRIGSKAAGAGAASARADARRAADARASLDRGARRDRIASS